MVNRVSIIFLMQIFAVCSLAAKPSAITYELTVGRFGDNIRSFTQAYWEAYKYNMPFLYIPFHGSERLKLHTQLQELTPEVQATYRTVKKLADDTRLEVTDNEDTLYIIPYFCRTDIDWKDETFVEQMRQLIFPSEPMALPEGIENGIAIHVRRGGGYHNDTERAMSLQPVHFPSLTYFARSLDHLVAQLEGRQLIFMCTDDPNPRAIAQALFNELEPETAARVEIRFRAQENFHDRNVLEDFMIFRSARYLIRPISNLSEYAELLGNPVCTVLPGRHRHHMGRPYGIIESAVFLYKDRPAEMVMLL